MSIVAPTEMTLTDGTHPQHIRAAHTCPQRLPSCANDVTEADLCASSPVRRGGPRLLVPLRTPKSRRLDDIMADADRAGKRTAAVVHDSESDGPIPKVCFLPLPSPSSPSAHLTSQQMLPT